MKIAMVTKYYNKHQGIPRVVAELSESLSKEHEVHVYTREWECDESHGITFHKVPQIEVTPRIPDYLNESMFFFYVGFCLRFSRFDIVNIHDPCFYPGGIFTCHAFPMGSIRIITELLNLPLKIRISRLFPEVLKYPVTNFNIKHRGTKRIIAVSRFIKDTLIKYSGRDGGTISVVHNGVDLQRFNPSIKESSRRTVFEQHRLSSDDFLISFVGHYLERKGLTFLLSALALLKNKKVKVLVVGQRVDQSPSVTEIINDNALEDQVISVGSVTNVEQYIAASDLLVLPSLYEPFGNVVVEAMACAVPVIVSPQTGAGELVKDGESGYILNNVLDTAELAEKIGRFVENRELSQLMGEKGERIAREHSWDTVVTETVKVFEEVYAESSGELSTERD